MPSFSSIFSLMREICTKQTVNWRHFKKYLITRLNVDFNLNGLFGDYAGTKMAYLFARQRLYFDEHGAA